MDRGKEKEKNQNGTPRKVVVTLVVGTIRGTKESRGKREKGGRGE